MDTSEQKHDVRELLRELVGCLTRIRAGSANEENAVAFMFDNAVAYHKYLDVRPESVKAEFDGLLAKLRTHRHDEAATVVQALGARLLGGTGPPRRSTLPWSMLHLLLELSGRPLGVTNAQLASAEALLSRPPDTVSQEDMHDHPVPHTVDGTLDAWRNEFDSEDSGDESEGEGADSESSSVGVSTKEQQPRKGDTEDRSASGGPSTSSMPTLAAQDVEAVFDGDVHGRTQEALPLHAVSSDSSRARLNATNASFSRCATEDAFVSSVLLALQGVDGTGASGALDAVFILSPYRLSASHVAPSPRGLLPLSDAVPTILPPRYAQLARSLDRVLALPLRTDGTDTASRLVADDLRSSVIEHGLSSGRAFVPLMLNDAAGHATARHLVGLGESGAHEGRGYLPDSPLESTEDLGPFLCVGIPSAALRVQLSAVLEVLNQCRWVSWVCTAVVHEATAPSSACRTDGSVQGLGIDLATLLGCADGDSVPMPRVQLYSFGPSSCQLASCVQGIVDDIRLDAACVLAAHCDRLDALGVTGDRTHQTTGGSSAPPTAFTSESALLSLLHEPSDTIGSERMHPRVTLTLLLSWLRQYKPILKLLQELCTRCFLSEPPSLLSSAVLGTCGSSQGSVLLQQHGDSWTDSDGLKTLQAALFSSLHAASSSVFSSWAAAQCLDVLLEMLQSHCITGACHIQATSLYSSDKSFYPATMPLLHLPVCLSIPSTITRLYLPCLSPFLRALDSFMMATTASPAVGLDASEIPFAAAADVAAEAQVLVRLLYDACLAHGKVQTSASKGGSKNGGGQLAFEKRRSGIVVSRGAAMTPQRLLFESSELEAAQDIGVTAELAAWAGLVEALVPTLLYADSYQPRVLPNSLTPSFLRFPASGTRSDNGDDLTSDSTLDTVVHSVLEARLCRGILSAVDDASERHDEVLQVDSSYDTVNAAVGDLQRHADHRIRFGELLFAPLAACFHAQLAETLLAKSGSSLGSSTALFTSDSEVNGLVTQHAKNEKAGGILQTTLDQDHVSSDNSGIGEDALGFDEECKLTAIPVATSTTGESASGLQSADVLVSSAASVRSGQEGSTGVTTTTDSSLPTAQRIVSSAGAASSRRGSQASVVQALNSSLLMSSASGSSGKPVFQPGYAPIPGMKRSAWWDIDAQVDTKKRTEEEEAQERERALSRGTARSSVSDDASLPDFSSVITSVSCAGPAPNLFPGRPPRRSSGGNRSPRSALVIPRAPGVLDMSAITEGTEEEDDNDGNEGELPSDFDDASDGEEGDAAAVSEQDDFFHDGRVALLPVEPTSGLALSLRHDEAIASMEVVTGIGAAQATPESTSALAAPVSVLKCTSQPSGPPSPPAWLLPEHFWDEATGKGHGLLQLGGHNEWQAVLALLYPTGDRRQGTSGAHESDSCRAPVQLDMLSDGFVPDNWDGDVRGELVSRIVQRDLVGCLLEQHKLLSAAVSHAFLQRLHLVQRHLWSLRAVCLFQQGNVMQQFTARLFEALRTPCRLGETSRLHVRNSFRLTQWLKGALGAPGSHLAVPSGAGSHAAHGPRMSADAQPEADVSYRCWLRPEDFSVAFVGFAAESDEQLLTSGLVIQYTPSQCFPLSLVFDADAMAVYNLLFGQLLWLQYVHSSVLEAARACHAAGRQVEALLARFPSDCRFSTALRSQLHATAARMHGVQQFVAGVHSHQLHSLLTGPWINLRHQLRGASSSSGSSSSRACPSLPDIHSAHAGYLASMQRLCLLGPGQRAAAASQQALLQRALQFARHAQAWCAVASAAAGAAWRSAGSDPAVLAMQELGATATRRHFSVSDATLAAAAAHCEAPLRHHAELAAEGVRFTQQLAFVVGAALAGPGAAAASSSQGSVSGVPALSDLAGVLDHSRFYSTLNRGGKGRA